ncbi:HK97 family phage prohead protease [Nocardioides sp.]|uniref:HK97 family phage prohead protease n=1 Tax=Nocardioides sp. TaxID=35761 RepID=UPI0035AE29F1
MTTEAIQRAARPPLADLCREAPFTLRAEDDGEAGDGLTLDGYAAVFNRETIIDSWEGRFKEDIAPGAMKKSFRENPPRVQFDHGRHMMIGSIPIAKLEKGYPREEVDPVLAPEGGAHVLARLHDNWLIQPVRDAIASGTIDGMSFRFSVVREQWRDHTGKVIRDEEELRQLLRRSWLEDVPDEELLRRTLQELRVPELGPVVWPAYVDTSVGVRSGEPTTVVIDLANLGDPEERTKLAQAVLMADRADSEEPPLTPEAEEHSDPSNDTPPITARSAAEEHESAARRAQREADLELVRANQTRIHERNKR